MVDLEELASLVDELESEPGSKFDPRLRELFGELIDQKHGAIGRVVASEQEPAGSHSFYFSGERRPAHARCRPYRGRLFGRCCCHRRGR